MVVVVVVALVVVGLVVVVGGAGCCCGPFLLLLQASVLYHLCCHRPCHELVFLHYVPATKLTGFPEPTLKQPIQYLENPPPLQRITDWAQNWCLQHHSGPVRPKLRRSSPPVCRGESSCNGPCHGISMLSELECRSL